MLMVISPAKKLDYETPVAFTDSSQPQFLPQAQDLIDQIKPLAPHDISSLMHISDALGQLNYDRFQNWSTPFTSDNARMALFAFKGDVYQGIEAETFSEADLAFAQGHLRILSGLYGLLRPQDLMQAYRLEMGTKFQNSKGKDLYEFWGGQITEALNQDLSANKSEYLVNLASNEYFKSVKKRDLNVPIITPIFKDNKNGQYKIISFYAKKARGLMAAFIIKNRIENVEDLKAFNEQGYVYNEALSKGNDWVFTRESAE